MKENICTVKHLFGLCFLLCILGTISASTCGYEACSKGKEDMLNVHVICHTHDDVGWVHTVDEYYDMWVRNIITSAVNNLLQNENRKFIYVETVFFSMWWDEQNELTRENVRRLVNNGQLEFISGGWSLNDEATPHYLALIDQMTLGLRWLNDTFGTCGRPNVGWQIDPFGHSREFASILAQMKFDGLFQGRIHYQDKDYREKTKTMEVVWKTSDSLGEQSNLFTGVLPNVYWPPSGFCFDVFCSDDELTEDNIIYKSRNFISMMEEKAKAYATNNIVVTMGNDFHYTYAEKWYRNLDFLISNVNSLQEEGMKVNMFYSTPTCYLQSLHESNMTWPTMKTDFLPYASNDHEYWTGYFTSRPALKYHVRKSNGFLQICKQLVTLADIEDADILPLKKALGVLQHHDGVSGTEKQYVSDDYTGMLSEGYALCQDAIDDSIRILLSNDTTLFCLHFCENLNASQCIFSETEDQFLVIVYNSLSHPIESFVRLPIISEGYSIKQLSRIEEYVPSQVVPLSPSIMNIPERSSLATNELVFPVTVPPLGFSVYGIERLEDFQSVSDLGSDNVTIPVQETTVQDVTIQNENLEVIIDGYSGLVKEILVKDTNTSVPLKQSFYYYKSDPGYTWERASGAYCFNPLHDDAIPVAENVSYKVLKGPLVEEVHQYYTPWISQIIRLYKGQNHVEFDWVVGPVPVQDYIGKEIITRFDTGIQSNGTFFTDTNSRETIKRVRNHQETFPWNTDEKVAGNYYPITSWIYIKDITENLQLSILPDRAQGGTSLTDGSLELMVHRRLLHDDGFGVDEALNEIGSDGKGLIVRGSHFLTLGRSIKVTSMNKRLAKERFHYPLVAFSKVNLGNLSRYALKEFQGLTRRLPQNVHVLTLERLDDQQVLLRLEHFYEKDDKFYLAHPATVSLSNIFRPFRVLGFQETTLAANKYLHEVERLKWSTVEDMEVYENRTNNLLEVLNSEITRNHDDAPTTITLNPMEIRTFLLKVEFRTTA